MSTSDDRIAGVLLAAGASSRFGDKNKLLVEVAGKPIVRHAAETLVAARLDPIVAVVGCDAKAVSNALADERLEIVENPEYRTGQASSLRVGIERIKDRSEAVVICLGDMPAIDVETIHTLCHAYRTGKGDALAAAYEGERGNPVLFGERWFAELLAIDGDIGGRNILREHGSLVETGDPGVRRDVDRPDDLAAIDTRE